MKENRIYQKLILLLYIAAVIYLCFGKFESLPNVSRSFFGIPTDKIVHFIMFFPMTILIYWAFDWKTDKLSKSLILTIGLLLFGLLMGTATEFGQGLTNYRSKDPLDFKADMLAVSISAFIVFIIDMIKNLRKCK